MIELVELRARLARVEATVPAIASSRVERRIAAIDQAMRLLADGEQRLGRELRNDLERSSGLSSEGIAWALDTTLGAVTRESLEAMVREASSAAGRATIVPRGLVVVILSANVATAPFFALSLPLLFGNAILAKASRRDDVAARAFVAALASVDPELAVSLDAVVFGGGDVEREDVLLGRANAVVAYGSDATIQTLRSRTPASSAFIAHGNGLGIGFVAREVLRDLASRREAIDAFALDVAAYDQRGCLSPHVIVVEGDDDQVRSFARDLAEQGLAPLAKRMPRGPLSTNAAAAQLAFRSIAIARGELFEGDGFSTSAEPSGPVRSSPGFRNVQVVSCVERERFGAIASTFGVHLKVVGVAGDDACRAAIAKSFVPPVAPRIVRAGTMQTPPFDAVWDAELPFTGLVRYAAGP